VGVPFLGLLGILRIGQGVVPPRSIGGTWELAVNETPPPDFGSCLELAPRAAPRLVVEQSGLHAQVELSAGRTVNIPVDVDGDLVSGATPLEGCPGGMLRLSAQLSPAAASGPSELAGTLALPGCDSCAPVSFRAVRQAAAASS
jgi:hypothetical protein